jgi:uncharacterized RmlC-like cupin family protein
VKAQEHDGVALIKPGQTYVGKQGFTYGAGASRETVGAKNICMSVLPMPPDALAKAHYHEGIETIAYVIEGEAVMYYGDQLERKITCRAGEQCFIAENVPHAPRNESGAPCLIVVVHSSGSDQDGIIMLPELDERLTKRLAAI